MWSDKLNNDSVLRVAQDNADGLTDEDLLADARARDCLERDTAQRDVDHFALFCLP